VRNDCGLDNDGASAIAGDIREHGCEAWARLDVISAAHRCVGELSHEFEPGARGEGCDSVSLALVAVFQGSDIGRAGRADIGYRVGQPSRLRISALPSVLPLRFTRG
jgi:hypothetical protein